MRDEIGFKSYRKISLVALPLIVGEYRAFSNGYDGHHRVFPRLLPGFPPFARVSCIQNDRGSSSRETSLAESRRVGMGLSSLGMAASRCLFALVSTRTFSADRIAVKIMSSRRWLRSSNGIASLCKGRFEVSTFSRPEKDPFV